MKTLSQFFITTIALTFVLTAYADTGATKVVPFPDADDQLFVGRGSSLDFSYAEAQENALNDAKATCHPLLATRVSNFTNYRLPGGLAGVGAFATFYCITYK